MSRWWQHIGSRMSLEPYIVLLRDERGKAILLLPILVFVVGITRDRGVMGEHASGRLGTGVAAVAIVLLALCVGALGVLSVL